MHFISTHTPGPINRKHCCQLRYFLFFRKYDNTDVEALLWLFRKIFNYSYLIFILLIYCHDI